MYRMTIEECLKAASNNKYLGFRFPSGHIMGVNSKNVLKSIIKRNKSLKDESPFCGFQALNINEYINCKHPFL